MQQLEKILPPEAGGTAAEWERAEGCSQRMRESMGQAQKGDSRPNANTVEFSRVFCKEDSPDLLQNRVFQLEGTSPFW